MPEIYKNGALIASVPDEYGVYPTLDGSHILVDPRGIEATKDNQPLIVEGPTIGGRRMIRLTQEGKGSTSNPKRGDLKNPKLDALLCERPIRISYRDQVWVERMRTLAGPNDGGYYREEKRTYYNPAWIR